MKIESYIKQMTKKGVRVLALAMREGKVYNGNIDRLIFLGVIFIINSLISFIGDYLLGHDGAPIFLVLCFDFSYIIRFVAMWWILTRKDIAKERMI